MKTNVRQLGRIVRSITGKTTKQIIDEDLVLEIKRRLVHGGASVGEIAEGLGFEETTNLVKYFKRHTGVTPGAFREAVQDLPGTDES
jgi:AraC-like DNA-binding protein